MRIGKSRGGYSCAFAALIAFVLVACGGGGGGGSSGGGSSGGGGGGGSAPAPDFSASPTSGTISTAIQFTDLSVGTPTSWQWDFDNNGTTDSTTQNPSHVYGTPGTYSVKLTVSNGSGSDLLVKTSYITIAPSTSVGPADIDVDTNRDGSITTGDDTNEHIWNAAGGAVFYLNQDDDDNNNTHDYNDTVSSGNDTNDLTPVFVRQVVNAPTGGSITVTVSTAAQGNIRVFRKNGSTYTSIYSAGTSFSLPVTDVAAGDIELGVEARNRVSSSWDGRVTLTLAVRDDTNALLSSDAVILRAAPPIFATNLWPAEEYHIVSITSSWSAPNGALRSAMQTICSQGGFTYREASGNSYSNDRWLQDSSEPAVIQLPSATGPRRVIDNVFQCARWRPCDNWCRDVLWGPEFDWFERFSTDNDSHNYGGNLEVVPPTTGRPYGTVCYGGGTGTKIGTSTTVTSNMIAAYRQFFDACELQGPSFNYTSEWLAVGHIDEFSMFIPAPNTARGWVCLIASPDRAYQVLQSAPSNAVVFQGRSYQTTVSSILGDTALQTLNNEVQTRIDQARTQIKNATGLTDADFIELPTLFENVGSNYMAAYNPGVVNLVCLPSTNGTIYLAIPDPEGPNNASSQDVWQLDINAQLAALDTTSNPYSITYVDVFESYHELLGEAHCGSNTVRTPPSDDWWNK